VTNSSEKHFFKVQLCSLEVLANISIFPDIRTTSLKREGLRTMLLQEIAKLNNHEVFISKKIAKFSSR